MSYSEDDVLFISDKNIEYEYLCWYSKLIDTITVKGVSYDANGYLRLTSKMPNKSHIDLTAQFFIPIGTK